MCASIANEVAAPTCVPTETRAIDKPIRGGDGKTRYNIVLPEDLVQRLQDIATAKQTTTIEIIRRFLKLGLVVAELENKPDTALIIRESGKDREVLLM